jgi:capsular exopolysaccharide synthesis family protein
LELIEYLRGLRRRWVVIVAAVIVGVVAASFTGGDPATDPEPADGFEASVLLLDNRGSQASFSRGSSGITIETLATLVTFDDVTNRAVKKLDVDTDPEELASTVSAVADSQRSILTITATADTGPRAERVADAFAKALIGYMTDLRADEIRPEINSLREQLNHSSGGRSGTENAGLIGQISALNAEIDSPIGLITEAEGAEEVLTGGLQGPSSLTGRLLIGAAIGLLGGIVLALVLERFDQRIRTRRAFEEHLPFPLLAEIPNIRGARKVEVAVRPLSVGADAVRLLASAVLHAMKSRWAPSDGNGHRPLPPSITIAVTSADRAEGKSLVSANLAGAFAELGLTVVVISCDLRRPTLHRFFNVPAQPGVVDALQAWDGQAGFRRIRHETNIPHVTVVPSGTPTQRPAAVLATEEMRNLLKLAGDEADIVILDTPALMLSGDAASLLQRADGVLLVSRIGKATIDSADRVSETLDRLGSPVIGFALNGTRRPSTGWHHRSYRSIAAADPIAPPASVPEAPSRPVAVEAEWTG